MKLKNLIVYPILGIACLLALLSVPSILMVGIAFAIDGQENETLGQYLERKEI